MRFIHQSNPGYHGVIIFELHAGHNIWGLAAAVLLGGSYQFWYGWFFFPKSAFAKRGLTVGFNVDGVDVAVRLMGLCPSSGRMSGDRKLGSAGPDELPAAALKLRDGAAELDSHPHLALSSAATRPRRHPVSLLLFSIISSTSICSRRSVRTAPATARDRRAPDAMAGSLVWAMMPQVW